jgi:hypothetical protein
VQHTMPAADKFRFKRKTLEKGGGKCGGGLEIKFREGVLVGGIMGWFFIDLSCRFDP